MIAFMISPLLQG